MGRTIRTIIVLLAAVMLLAGCDPKMGNQSGAEGQGGAGTQSGATINGIYFPRIESAPHYESFDTLDMKCAAIIGASEELSREARHPWPELGPDVPPPDPLPKESTNCEIITNERYAEHFKLKPGIRYRYYEPKEIIQATIWVTKWEAKSVGINENKNGHIHYVVGSFTFEDPDKGPYTTHDFVLARESNGETGLYDYMKIDGKYYNIMEAEREQRGK